MLGLAPITELTQFTNLKQFEVLVPSFANEKGRHANAHLAADIPDRLSHLRLLQGEQDPRLGKRRLIFWTLGENSKLRIPLLLLFLSERQTSVQAVKVPRIFFLTLYEYEDQESNYYQKLKLVGSF